MSDITRTIPELGDGGFITNDDLIRIARPDGQAHRDMRAKMGYSYSGAAGNLSVIPAGVSVSLSENAQSQVFVSLTVNGSYQVDGELRVGAAWPT